MNKFNKLYKTLILQASNGSLQKKKLKLVEYKQKLQELQNTLKVDQQQLENMKQKLISNFPELTGQLDDLRTAKKAFNKLPPDHNKIEGNNFIFSDFEFDMKYRIPDDIKAIERQKNKIALLEQELGTFLTDPSVDLANNLPQQFIDALQIIHQNIKNQLENQKNDIINKVNNYLLNPVLNGYIFSKLRYTTDYYTYQRLVKHDLFKSEEYDDPNYRIFSNCYKQGLNGDNYTNDQDFINDILKFVVTTKYYNTESYVNIIKKYILNNNLSEYSTRAFNRIKTPYQNKNIESEAQIIFDNMKAKFVDQISRYVTKIITCDNVEIGQDGSLNGYITADNGKWYIKTIVAGGYNIQCLHYRVIMRPYKG